MPQEYDNELRGSLWKTNVAAEGTAQIEQVKFRAYLTTLNAQAEKAPNAIMFFLSLDKNLCFHAALWRKKDGKPEHLYQGSLIVASGRAYWVNVYKVTSDNPKAPALNVSFQQKDPPPEGAGYQAPEPDMDEDENIPF